MAKSLREAKSFALRRAGILQLVLALLRHTGQAKSWGGGGGGTDFWLPFAFANKA